jgi:hypothetical protein
MMDMPSVLDGVSTNEEEKNEAQLSVAGYLLIKANVNGIWITWN